MSKEVNGFYRDKNISILVCFVLKFFLVEKVVSNVS